MSSPHSPIQLSVLEDALWEAARALLPAGALDPRSLATAIVERTKRYTSERERLAAPLPGKERARDLAARALFFGVADAPKIAVPLGELLRRGLLPSRTSLRVLDLGAGAGAMSLGAALFLADRALDILAVDQDAEALALLGRAAPQLAGTTVRTVAADVTRFVPPEPRFDLILAGTMLNELPEALRLPLVRRLLADHLAEDGALILVEPALRDTSRALHRLRDALLADGAGHVFAPCTRRAPTCPALDDERDWCHEDRSFDPSPRLAGLARTTGLRTGGLKFAYLTLRRGAEPLVEVPSDRRALRVVSDNLDQKGTTERIVCGDEGRQRLRVLRRDRTDANRAFGSARRGDVLVLDDASSDGPPAIELVRP